MHAGAQEILILMSTEHASTTSPDDETQKYDFLYQDKGADQIGTSEMTCEEFRA